MEVNSPVYLTRNEVASKLKVHPLTVREWEKKNRIKPCAYVGSRPRYELLDVLELEGRKDFRDDWYEVEMLRLFLLQKTIQEISAETKIPERNVKETITKLCKKIIAQVNK